MGEQWQVHHNLKENQNLKETGGLETVELGREMSLVEKTALQTALAIHVFLSTKKRTIDDVDFVHPWANKHINRNEVMKEWLLSKEGKPNAEKLGEFLEAMDPNEHEIINLAEKQKREALLSRMHIDFQPPSDSGATMH